MAFPTRLQQLLEEGRIVVRSLGEFQFGTGFWYMWNGSSEFTWNGNTYIPNQLIAIEEPPYQMGLKLFRLRSLCLRQRITA